MVASCLNVNETANITYLVVLGVEVLNFATTNISSIHNVVTYKTCYPDSTFAVKGLHQDNENCM